MSAYFFAKISSGKDPAYRKYEGVCRQCLKGSDLDKGVRLAGAGKRKHKAVNTLTDLYKLYHKFEADRVKKAVELTKREDIRPDPFCKFIVEKTDICPHKIISPLSRYWLDTIIMLDGEMGLTLPDKISEIPGIFFEALSLVRSNKHIVSKEDKEQK